MDLKMNVQKINHAGVTWDCVVENGNVPIIYGTRENFQSAILAGFLIFGTVPQLPDVGVPWVDFITGKITFGLLDFYVRESMSDAMIYDFSPEYDLDGDKLIMTVSYNGNNKDV